jgi:hypothetical protein
MHFHHLCRAAVASAVYFLMLSALIVAPAVAADASAVVAQAATGTLTGTVTTVGGATVPGATITVSGRSTSSATSDANGAFSLVVAPGLYSVSVSKAGYRTSSVSDMSVAQGTTQPLTVTLSALDLSSLRTIGSVQSSRGGAAINTSAAQINVVSAQQFANYATPQINDILQRIPDVVIQKLGTQQDQSIVIGGLQPYETQVLIDGHPIALGQYGVWFTQYFPSFLLGSVETQSGPANTTPFANIAVGGTANLLTPAFTTKTTFASANRLRQLAIANQQPDPHR